MDTSNVEFLFMRQDFLILPRVQSTSENMKRIVSHKETLNPFSMPNTSNILFITFSLVFDGDIYMTSSVCDAQPS